MSRFPFLASGGMVSSNAWRMKKPKLVSNITPMPLTKSSKQKKSQQFKYKPV